MKKLKEFYKSNRIYCILMLISIICFIMIATGVIAYFIGQATPNNYGNRLEGIENYNVSKDLSELEKFYKEEKKVTKSNVRLQGKIIYVEATVEKDIKNEDIEGIATASLEKISEENRGFYDMQFIFEREGLTPYLGSKGASNTTIRWNNYTFETEEETKK